MYISISVSANHIAYIMHDCSSIIMHIYIYVSIYIIECSFVCLFVRGKRQNYGTD